MARFDYKAATWKKMKPPLFPKTGMTEALDQFEKARKKLLSAKDLEDVLQFGGAAMAAFDHVEACRKTALTKASKVFKDTRSALAKAPSAATVNELHEAIAKVGGRELDGLAKKLQTILVDKQKRFDEITKILNKLRTVGSMGSIAQMKFLSEVHTGYLQQSSSISGGRRQAFPGISSTQIGMLTKRRVKQVEDNAPMLLTKFHRAVDLVDEVRKKDEAVARLELTLREDATPRLREAGIIV